MMAALNHARGMQDISALDIGCKQYLWHRLVRTYQASSQILEMGWLCRIFHMSSCSEGRALAFEEAFMSECSLAGFLKDLLARGTKDWILCWVSAKGRGDSSDCVKKVAVTHFTCSRCFSPLPLPI